MHRKHGVRTSIRREDGTRSGLGAQAADGHLGLVVGLPFLLFVSLLLYVSGKERGQPAATPIIRANQSKDLGAQVMAPAEFIFSSPNLGYAIPKGHWFAETKAAQQQLRVLRNQGPSLAKGDWLGAHPEPGRALRNILPANRIDPPHSDMSSDPATLWPWRRSATAV